jgi:hypothetical protein
MFSRGGRHLPTKTIFENGLDFDVEGDAQWQNEVSTKQSWLADSEAMLKPGIHKVAPLFRGFRWR